MPIITKEDKEFLEYAAYRLNAMLFACSPGESESDGKVVDFTKYSEKIGYEIKKFSETIKKPPCQAANAVLQLNKDVGANQFTKKEIKEMPRLTDFKIRIKNGKYYEIRFRRYGYDMSFSSTDFEEAKRKAFAWLSEFESQIKPNVHFTVLSKRESEHFNVSKKVLFKTFADEFMYKIKKKRVKPISFKTYENKYLNYILPEFGKMRLCDVKPFTLQMFLDKIHAKAPRGCEDVKTVLNNILDYAVANGVIDRNPMAAVYIPRHERTHGSALTLEEEKKFVNDIRGNKFEFVFLRMLYSGARPCEVFEITEDYENNTLTIQNGKLKSYQKNKTRTIPIFPKYRAALFGVTIKKGHINKLEHEFRNFCPGHSLKDLRHTFTTRARECGVENELVAIWTGHSLGNITASVYTHFSDEFQQKQAKKLDY